MKIISKHFYIFNYLIFGSIFFHLSRQMLQIRSDGWYVGHINLYGDLVYHLGLINKFVAQKSILIESPIFAHDKINYPPLPDYITAVISQVAGIDFALFSTTFLIGLTTIFIARILLLNILKNEKIIFLSLLLFFFNGGLGFYYFFVDYFRSGKGMFDFLLSMPNTYTQLKDIGYYWINNYLAYFLPQRSFHFAFPVALVAVTLLYIGNQKGNRSYYFLAGILAGSLPLLQAHSLLVIFILCIFFAPASILINKNKRETIINWTIFAVSTAIIALPIFQLISSIPSPISFIKIDIGWTSDENLIWFWIKNLGFFLPTYITSLIYCYKIKSLFTLHIPFLFIFVISNIVIFQPWDFDNSKLFIYWYFSACTLVSYFIYKYFLIENIYRKVVGLVLIFLMTFSGALDIFRTFTNVTNYQIFTNKDLEVAEKIKLLTPTSSTFITATNHNHPIPSLSGRSTYLGFTGWVWSHGIDYSQREVDIKNIYLGGETASRTIQINKINYITVGPAELQTYSINESYLNAFPKIHLTEGWDLYDVSNLWPDSNR